MYISIHVEYRYIFIPVFMWSTVIYLYQYSCGVPLCIYTSIHVEYRYVFIPVFMWSTRYVFIPVFMWSTVIYLYQYSCGVPVMYLYQYSCGVPLYICTSIHVEYRYIFIPVFMWSTVILVHFGDTWIFSKIFEKYSNIKFHENTSSGSRVVPCRQTKVHDAANGRFSQFCALA
jgi:hypothetical protein